MKHFIQLFKKKRLGLKPQTEDLNDYPSEVLGWGKVGYTPKKESSGLVPLTTKDQYRNTCQWNALAGSKEIDEKIELDEQSTVLFGMREGLISGDGFSNLRSGQLILQKYGICRKGLLNNNRNSWNIYSNVSQLTPDVLKDASKHKSQTFWSVSNYYQALQALDEGHPVCFGMGWRTSMNMNGGFSFPWLLNFLLGYLIGGHAVYIFDWKFSYQGKDCFEGKNSFGKDWGNKGSFFITFEDFNKEIKKYGAYANVDIEKGVAKWLIANNGKCIKESDGVRIYFIENGKKRLFPDMLTFKAFGFSSTDIIEDGEDMLREIPDGDDFSIYNSPKLGWFFELFKMDKDGILKEQFNKYFT